MKKARAAFNSSMRQTAMPLLSAKQLLAAMAWDWPIGQTSHQPALPFSPNAEQTNLRKCRHPTAPRSQAQLIGLLNEKQPLSFEDLITLTRHPIPSISFALLNLEIKGIVRSLPGRRYQLAPADHRTPPRWQSTRSTKIWTIPSACPIFAHGKNKFPRWQVILPLKIFRRRTHI